MGLLAPLYLVGLLAIGVPIILHLIRRTPQGKQMFSTLMFLTPSPPRLTKRSRLTNLLLLLIRALAVILLAFAFMRPFLNSAGIIEPQKSTGHRIAILVDTSASMRRGDLWRQAQREVDRVMADASPFDEVGLYFFDTELRPGLSFNQWNDADAGSRIPLVKSRMAETTPGWAGTRMGDALGSLVDIVEQSDSKQKDARNIDRRIVLITDNQQGGHVEALQSHQWPADVYVQRAYVSVSTPGNASLMWIPQTTSEKADGLLRIKVSNELDSKLEQFTLTWSTDKGPLPGAVPEKVYVTPGQSKIVKVAWPEEGTPDRLVLGGDASDFDNTLFLSHPRLENVKVLYIGSETAGDVNGMRYYLQSALADTSRRHVDIAGKKATEELTDADLSGVRLVVVGAMADRPQGTDDGEVTEATADRLKKFVESGGDVLWVMRDLGSRKPLARLLGEEWQMDEVTGNYALLSRIDVTHPLFALFSDVRFGDFTRIHFWKHRKVVIPDSRGVLAWFDTGDPFMIERLLGDKGGRVRVMTSGWNPTDSQLALSTKFVPLIERAMRRKDEVVVEAQYAVNEPIGLPEAQGQAGGPRSVVLPTGKSVSVAANSATFAATDAPGIYQLKIGENETPVAENIAPDESRTLPLAADEIEKWGAKTGVPVSAAEAAEKEKRLRSTELENRQKLWQWLIVIVLGLLGLETFLAGLQARRSPQEKAAL